VTVIVDETVENMVNAVYGANQADHHYTNVNYGRDYEADIVTDVRLIQEGDPCPKCGAPVKAARGIEVGQVFKLYTKYSAALKATFLDENGKEKPMVMGCYGVGVSRTMAAAIEQNHDENGIIWAASIAPYHAVIVPINAKDEAQMALAEELYEALGAAKVECVLDDRKERAGVKFKDADLIGYPLKITVGPKAIQENQIEVKVRKTGETYYFTKETYLEEVQALLKTL
jgi:prolyl-tRNA synthetase